eukprot:PhF_6_TR43668/c0_g1_i1/m.67104
MYDLGNGLASITYDTVFKLSSSSSQSQNSTPPPQPYTSNELSIVTTTTSSSTTPPPCPCPSEISPKSATKLIHQGLSKLFLGQLPPEADRAIVSTILSFLLCSDVQPKQVVIMFDKHSKVSTGSGFVHLEEPLAMKLLEYHHRVLMAPDQLLIAANAQAMSNVVAVHRMLSLHMRGAIVIERPRGERLAIKQQQQQQEQDQQPTVVVKKWRHNPYDFVDTVVEQK